MLQEETSFHDWLAIGEIDCALAEGQRNPKEEISRLPLFLRLLSASQPLAAIPVLLPNQVSRKQEMSSDPLLDSVVSKLEDVAAMYSEAEGIDALTACHAPNLTRRLSKVTPLKRKQGGWLTSELTSTGGLQKKRRLSNEVHYNTASESDDDMVIDADIQTPFEELPREAADAGNSIPNNNLIKEIGKLHRKSDATMLKEDSQEALVSKILQELTGLVVDALKNPALDDDGNPVALKSKADSILAEADATGVGPTLAALMYHLPVLRHEHVANSFCRTNLPQAPVFLLRMGQNCPAAVPAMIRGCIAAVKESPTTVKTCLRSLAGLSEREAYRVRSALQKPNLLVDLQLEIALDHDAAGVACILNRELEDMKEFWDHGDATQDVPVRVSSEGVLRMSATGRRQSAYAGRRHSSTSIEIVEGMSKTFATILKENSALTVRTYEKVLDEVQIGGQGRRIMFLRALTWLLYKVGGTFNLKKVATVLKEVGKDHGYFPLQLSTSLLLCARAVVAEGITDHVRTSCQRLFFNLISERDISLRSKIFVSQMASFIHSHDVQDLSSLIVHVMKGKEPDMSAEMEVGLSKMCIWTVSNVDLIKFIENGLTEEAILEDSSALMCAISRQHLSTVENTIKSIFRCPDKCFHLLAQLSVIKLIQEVAVVNHKIGTIPLVLPMDLESLSRKIDFCARPLAPCHAQFLLQFAYCLCMTENNPDSPFSVEPREFPANEVLELCKMRSELLGLNGLECFFRLTFSRICPEVLVGVEVYTTGPSHVEVPTNSRHKMMSMISKSITMCAEDSNFDPSGTEAERLFLSGKRRFPAIDVDSIAVKALLTTTNSPSLYLTNSMLIRDPLVLFRCPVLVWKKQGLRRIILVILQRLLQANAYAVSHTSQTEEVAEELLASRDSVVIRCLLVLSSGREERMKALHCSRVTSMIRSILSKRQGLVTALAKQGHLTDCAVDFLVDFVPEIINDAGALTSLLSERSPLTAAERLRMADVALRIAIAHGSKNEQEAKNLAYAALTQLTLSFFLVIGPVGVPVNVMIEESGNDVTLVCRSAAHRMLDALQKVRGDRAGLRNECANALQKLAGMCKGDNIMSGVGGSAAQSRKKVLKQIWESITKACNAMATGVQI